MFSWFEAILLMGHFCPSPVPQFLRFPFVFFLFLYLFLFFLSLSLFCLAHDCILKNPCEHLWLAIFTSLNRSRTKNLMWYGVLGGKEMINQTFKNLDQRVLLECDGQRIPLPSLRGIVILNIPRFVRGSPPTPHLSVSICYSSKIFNNVNETKFQIQIQIFSSCNKIL